MLITPEYVFKDVTHITPEWLAAKGITALVLDIDNTPLLLGMILEDIMEQNFVTASMSYDRNYSIFITRPISAVILIITVVLLVSMIRVNRRVAKLNEQQEAQMAAEHAKMENA